MNFALLPWFPLFLSLNLLTELREALEEKHEGEKSHQLNYSSEEMQEREVEVWSVALKKASSLHRNVCEDQSYIIQILINDIKGRDIPKTR